MYVGRGVCSVILVVLCSLCLCCKAERVKRVIGGEEVACGKQPRVASLRNATSAAHICGATLISPRFALTAAHCVLHSAREYSLRFNNHCAEVLTDVVVVEIIINELYDEVSRGHDIALLRIIHDFKDAVWTTHNILPISSFGLSGDCILYGYGNKHKDERETSDSLLSGGVSIVSLDECTERLGPYVAPAPDSGMVCAVGAGVDACQGDSGAPLICNGLVHAISSYGVSCGVPDLPGVYTSVGAHVQWINRIINSR